MEKEIYIIDRPGEVKMDFVLDQDNSKRDILIIIKARSEGEFVINTLTKHVGKDTWGRVEIRGVIEGGARVKVDGMVKIEKNAEGSDSFLSMKMLVLDNVSSATAEPMLEIENNKVKASHSASVGRVDEEQLMYLKSRGLDRKTAMELIVEGFLELNDTKDYQLN